MKRIIKKFPKSKSSLREDQYKKIKIKINTQTYQHLPGDKQSVWFSCSDSEKTSKKRRVQKQKILGQHSLKKQYPSCYIYVNAGKGGTLYFFLGKKNAIRKKRIEENNKLYGKSETKNFQFNDDKKIILFTYSGPWDLELKNSIKTEKVVKNFQIIFQRPIDYDKCKENMLPYLELKGKYYQDIGGI